MSGITFTAIDFETANRDRASACAIGLCAVTDGEIDDIKSFLIRPPEESCWFDSVNVSIHGITFEKVRNCGRFGDIWPGLEPLLKGRVIAAHNMPFDRSVLEKLLGRYSIKPVHSGAVCTLKLSRKAIPGLADYRLDTVSEGIGSGMAGKHHDAGADAGACARILLHIASAVGLKDIGEVMSFAESKNSPVRTLMTRTACKPAPAPAQQIKNPAASVWKPGMGSMGKICGEAPCVRPVVPDEEENVYISDAALDMIGRLPATEGDSLPTAKQVSYMKYLRGRYGAKITASDVLSKRSAQAWISETVETYGAGHSR